MIPLLEVRDCEIILALYREKFRRRLPESLEELHGPIQGVVELPLHMAWSASYFFSTLVYHRPSTLVRVTLS